MNQHTLNLPGYKIAYKTWGNINLPPVLAIHGWLDNANSFDLIAPYLESQFYLIAVDLPGHGFSSHVPEGHPYHFIDAVLICQQFIQALKCETLHLIGHSLGACIASILAGICPSIFQSLSLIEALGPFSAPADSCCHQLRNYIMLPRKNSSKTRTFSSLEEAAMIRSIKSSLTKDLAMIICERSLVNTSDGFYWSHDKRLYTNSPLMLTEEQVLSCLKEIHFPTQLILADQEYLKEKMLISDRINAVNNIEVFQLNGGHHIHMEQPEAVSRLLVRHMTNF